MKSISVIRFTSLFLAGAMLASATESDDRNYQAAASKLLKEVQFTAGQLTREAGTLGSSTRGGMSRASHGYQLTVIKDRINALGERLAMLQAIREDAALWQQQAIDSMMPVALKLAAHTEAAILHFNESAKPLWHPDYTGHLRAISDRSGQVKEIVDLHLDMNRLRDRAVSYNN